MAVEDGITIITTIIGVADITTIITATIGDGLGIDTTTIIIIIEVFGVPPTGGTFLPKENRMTELYIIYFLLGASWDYKEFSPFTNISFGLIFITIRWCIGKIIKGRKTAD
jgi:hypothetical protein